MKCLINVNILCSSPPRRGLYSYRLDYLERQKYHKLTKLQHSGFYSKKSGILLSNGPNKAAAEDEVAMETEENDDAFGEKEKTNSEKEPGFSLDNFLSFYGRTDEGVSVFTSCLVGVMTGLCVVIFNYAVHEIHDLVWKDIPRISWFRSHALEETWKHRIFVPVGGGIFVGLINSFQSFLDISAEEDRSAASQESKIRNLLKPVLKAVASAVTLGTGNSLGPEGPSVEIGASIAKGVGAVLKNSRDRTLSLVAAGSAAGISSGFNAAIAGCFFAVESVLKSSSNAESASSLTTAMVLLSSVLASIISQAGLGSDPAFKIPAYDFRSPSELPLYLLLGILCGVVSVAVTKGSSFATTIFDRLEERRIIPVWCFPPLGGLCVGIIALIYPEVLYWGFENVDVFLESRPWWTRGPPADLLLQLVGAKIVATSLCRGSRLVGGVYAPSLFIGAALGSAYGKLANYAIVHADPMYHLDALQVAAPQAYALVGMAATLAGVCQVPLTAVLLLFELTRDYRIVLPLMAAVGLSSWIGSLSARNKKQSTGNKLKASRETNQAAQNIYFRATDICDVDESLCLTETDIDEKQLAEEILVVDAMRSTFVKVAPYATLEETLELILAEKEWCVLIVEDHHLKGILTLGDIQKEAEKFTTNEKKQEMKQRAVSHICDKLRASKVITVDGEMTLATAKQLMGGRGLRQLPVLGNTGNLVGIIDRESIRLACRAEATRRLLAYKNDQEH